MTTENGKALDKVELAKRVFAARKEKGLFQKDLAERAKVEMHFVNTVEKGTYAFRNSEAFEYLRRLADYLGIEVPWVSEEALAAREGETTVFSVKAPAVPSRLEDAEITALFLCQKALGTLAEEPESLERVLRYVVDRYLPKHSLEATE